MDYLELFNRLIALARPVNASKAEAKSLEQNLKDTGLDSLDLLMIGIYLSDVFGVDEETAKQGQFTTVGGMCHYFALYGTKKPQTVEEALKDVQ